MYIKLQLSSVSNSLKIINLIALIQRKIQSLQQLYQNPSVSIFLAIHTFISSFKKNAMGLLSLFIELQAF